MVFQAKYILFFFFFCIVTSENIYLGPILYCDLSTKLLFPRGFGIRHRISRPSWLQSPPSQDAMAWKGYNPWVSSKLDAKELIQGHWEIDFFFQIPNPAYPTPNKLSVHFLWKSLVCALVVPWKDNTGFLLMNTKFVAHLWAAVLFGYHFTFSISRGPSPFDVHH